MLGLSTSVHAETNNVDRIAQIRAKIAELMAMLEKLQNNEGSNQACFVFSKDIQIRDKGTQVAELQSRLIKMGYSIADGEQPQKDGDTVDKSYFGESTAAAVVKFQQANGMPATGYVGALTRAKLNSLGCSDNKPTVVVVDNGSDDESTLNFSDNKKAGYYIKSLAVKRSFGTGEYVSFKNVKGVETVGGISDPTPEEGFHVQARLEKDDSTKGGIDSINAVYNYQTKSWSGVFSRYLAPGDYKLVVILYCSNHTLSCYTTHGDSYQAEKEISIKVRGSDYTSSCPYTGASGCLVTANGLRIDRSKDNFGTIRFTAPKGGAYEINTKVAQSIDGETSYDSDFYVLVNNREVYGKNLKPFEKDSYNKSFTLEKGDTIEFLVGRGIDGRQYGSGLAIWATIEVGNEEYSLAEDIKSNDDAKQAPWSFGNKPTMSGEFQLLPIYEPTSDDNGMRVDAWVASNGTLPAVYKNNNSKDAIANQGESRFPSGTVWFYPGFDSNYGYVAPTTRNGSQSAYKPVIYSVSGKAAGNGEIDANSTMYISGARLTGKNTDVYLAGKKVEITQLYDTNIIAQTPKNLLIGKTYDVYVVTDQGKSNVMKVKVLSVVTQEKADLKILSPIGGEKYESDDKIAISYAGVNLSGILTAYLYSSIDGNRGVYKEYGHMGTGKGQLYFDIAGYVKGGATSGKYKITLCDEGRVDPNATFKPLCTTSNEFNIVDINAVIGNGDDDN